MDHPVPENFSHGIPPKPETGLDLQMQAELIKRAKVSGVPAQEWVDKYAESFREIIKANPYLVESYPQDKEKTLQELQQLLEGSLKK